MTPRTQKVRDTRLCADLQWQSTISHHGKASMRRRATGPNRTQSRRPESAVPGERRRTPSLQVSPRTTSSSLLTWALTAPLWWVPCRLWVDLGLLQIATLKRLNYRGNNVSNINENTVSAATLVRLTPGYRGAAQVGHTHKSMGQSHGAHGLQWRSA